MHIPYMRGRMMSGCFGYSDTCFIDKVAFPNKATKEITLLVRVAYTDATFVENRCGCFFWWIKLFPILQHWVNR